MKGIRSLGQIAVLLVLIGHSLQAIAASTIPVKILPSKISMGQRFSLILSIPELPTDQSPDLRPLQKDFRILGTQESFASSNYNGQIQSTRQWILLLQPKHPGQLVIPSLKIGPLQSETAQIEVTAVANTMEAGEEQEAAFSPVFLKTQLSKTDPYVKEQVLYSVKLYNAVQLIDVRFQPPQVENALVIPLGQASQSQEEHQGRSYAVSELRYAIFPDKPGPLTIQGPHLEALRFDALGEPLQLRAKNRQLEVKPIPRTENASSWLPAKSIKLEEQFAANPGLLTPGSLLTRTIHVQAHGLPAQFLPSFNFSSSDALRVHAEKAVEKNNLVQGELLGRTSIKVNYLLKKAGKISLPSIELPWFNTSTGQMEKQILPARLLEVGLSKTAVPKAKPKVESAGDKILAPLPKAKKGLSHWMFLLLISCADLLIFGLIGWYFRRKYQGGKAKRLAKKALKRACKTENPEAIKAALMHWAKLQWPERKILSLSDISTALADPDAEAVITALNAQLYASAANKDCSGRKLWDLLRRHRPK